MSDYEENRPVYVKEACERIARVMNYRGILIDGKPATPLAVYEYSPTGEMWPVYELFQIFCKDGIHINGFVEYLKQTRIQPRITRKPPPTIVFIMEHGSYQL